MAWLRVSRVKLNLNSWTVLRAATFTFGAAAIHLAVMPGHLREYIPFGVFFLVTAMAQAGLAAALLVAPGRLLAIYGAEGNLALVALWLMSRTVGVPIGPNPWHPELVGLADTAATTLELLAVWSLVRLARRPQGSKSSSLRFRIRPVLTLLPGLLLTFIGVEGGMEDMPNSVNMSAQVPPGQIAIPIDTLQAPPGSEPLRSLTLVAEQAQIGGRTAWTFNGTVPGPELRVTQGDRLHVTLINHLPASTTIHWHGVQVPNAEDGVAGVTQNAVLPGHGYTYAFVVKDAGTFWYHSHQDTANQLTSGLFGALVVEPAHEEVTGRDYALIFHDFPGRTIISPGLLGLAGYVRQAFTRQVVAVNGVQGDLRLQARSGELVRLRMIAALEGEQNGLLMMLAQPLELVAAGTCYRVVAIDGNNVNQPQCIGPQRMRLGIGQRYDVSFVMPATGSVRIVDTMGHEQVTVGEGRPPVISDASRLPMFDPLQYGVPAPDPILGHVFDATYEVVLGEQGGVRNLQPELIHTIDGKASPMGTTYLVRQGQVVRLHIVNQTDEFHVMHLHGHILTVLDRDGRAARGSPIHVDSLLLAPRERWGVAFVADNLGLWMFHCHVLLHAAMGMSAMISYEGVTTPYDIGGPFGNRPE